MEGKEYTFSATKGRDIESSYAHTPEGAKRLADIYYSFGWNISEIFNTKTCRVIRAAHNHKEVI